MASKMFLNLTALKKTLLFYLLIIKNLNFMLINTVFKFAN